MSIVKCMKCGRILATREHILDKEIYVCDDCRRQYKEKQSAGVKE